ncbi:MAG: hypothetical protein B1H03_03320 [Planctomycetales bacterium 4484_113]|nr:MAG: hypothetical protein B1H03_03320 [Planctomycetales bacterium 4484_113]
MPVRIDINLLPPEFRPAPPVRWTPPFLALLYSLGLFLILWFIFHSMADLTAKREEIASVKNTIKMLKPFEEAYDASQDAVSTLENLKTLFAYLDTHYVDWPLFLRHLQPHVPAQVWLTAASSEVLKTAQVRGKGAKKETVSLEHEGKITIEGSVNGYPLLPIATFLSNLRQDPYFVNPMLLGTRLEETEAMASRSFIITTKVAKLGGGAEEENAKQSNGTGAPGQ